MSLLFYIYMFQTAEKKNIKKKHKITRPLITFTTRIKKQSVNIKCFAFIAIWAMERNVFIALCNFFISGVEIECAVQVMRFLIL